MDDGGAIRYRWDADVSAHDVEMDGATVSDGASSQGDSRTDGAAAQVVGDAAGSGVRLSDYCPDVAATPHTVRLSSLLRRVLETPEGAPVAEVDLSPIR